MPRGGSAMTPRTIALSLACLLARPAGAADFTCTFAKLGAAGKKVTANLKCHQRATERGAAVDPACLDRAGQTFAGRFARAELHPPCFAVGDAASSEATIDGLIDDLVAALRPTTERSLCAGAKLAVAGKRGAAQLNCHRSAVVRGQVVKPECVTDAKDRFATDWARAELRPDCLTGS